MAAVPTYEAYTRCPPMSKNPLDFADSVIERVHRHGLLGMNERL